jgi:hypothetical protein
VLSDRGEWRRAYHQRFIAIRRKTTEVRRDALTLYLECCGAPRRGLREIDLAAVGSSTSAWLRGITRAPCPVPK